MNYDQKQQLIFYLFLRIVILSNHEKFSCHQNSSSVIEIQNPSKIIETINSKAVSYIFFSQPILRKKKKKSFPP